MNWNIRNFIQDANEIIRFSYKRYGITKGGKFFKFSDEILKSDVDNVRTIEECINSKYWNCIENVMIMARTAKKHGLTPKVTVMQNIFCSNWIHCILKIDDLHFDNMIFNGEFTQVQLNPGINYRLIDIPMINPGMNRKDILRIIAKS